MAQKKKYHSTKKHNPALSVMKYYKMDKYVTEMFAAFAIALKEHWNENDQEIENDDIIYLLSKVMEEWQKSTIMNYDIADYCNSKYDIDVRRAGHGES